MKKNLNENYIGVCHYCGAIFRSNKHTREFCPGTSHRQMNGKHGPRINPLLEDENGNLINAGHLLRKIYEERRDKNKDGWSAAYPGYMLREQFAYTGPLPQGAELLVVASFLIRQSLSYPFMKPRFTVKPIHLLTGDEKGTREFVSAKEALAGKEVVFPESKSVGDSEE
jgi:hypothetical protein